MKRKITLKDIARELDVSISTVSKALKNSEEISRDTKEKVQAFARLYNYRPNNIAISLKNKRTKNIGVILPDIVHHFFTTVFHGIEKYANARGYNVIACISDESFDKEVINMEMLANGSIDGFIMALSAGTQLKNDYNHLRQVTDQGIPLVLFDRVTDEVACDKVVINDEEAAYLAVKKMINSGRKRIALLTSEAHFNVSEKRAEGYYRALREHSLPVDEELVLVLPHMYHEENLSEGFFRRTNPDAVLCVNEIYAVRSMRHLQSQGKRIPQDVAVIGFTDGILSRYSIPSLTSIAQHGELMGETAARLLVDRIEADFRDMDEPEYITEVIKASIIDRESTD
ncbi:LacI family DNA-binding transcriptional regulator [Lentiprolixibacter aurantiacus]|uniref:LacI family DNA-binding transcriptional regulator n=1 Tax=Lentiprolixibacter aurantiacus TaxID=2993939 RepID=A0AAE3SM40_9FLAO|nr:LacI family DNA-binding transcriptional regulator [Lentiprolixibacter aurantiacus]MCX2718169.1 LacI family DNA-binding transcriptional regulator [Lentiprolixibacter aurantiacus]